MGEEKKAKKAIVEIEGKQLKRVLGVMGGLLSEALVTFRTDGMEVIEAEPANVAMLRLILPTEAFLQYRVKEETKVGLDIKRLTEVVRYDCPLLLRVGEKLEFRQGGASFRLNPVKEEHMRKPLAKLPTFDEPTLEATCGVQGLKAAVGMATKFDDYVVMRISARGLEIATRDSRKLISKATFSAKIPSKCSHTGKKESLFSLDYLSDILKPLSGEVILHIGDDLPLKLETQIGEHGRATIFLAPRVES